MDHKTKYKSYKSITERRKVLARRQREYYKKKRDEQKKYFVIYKIHRRPLRDIRF